MAKRTTGAAAPKPAARQDKKTVAPKERATRRGRETDNGGNDETSQAEAFDNTKPQGSVDPGKYVAVIEEMVLQPADEKGRSARMKYGIATDGEFRGEQLAQFYKLFEADGSAGKGAAFLKKDLAVLGYSDIKFTDLEEAFEEIVKRDMGVVITVKLNGTFTNCYLNGLAEENDEVVQEYLDSRAF